MNIKSKFEERFKRKSVLAALLLVIVAALTLEATSLIQYYYAEKGLKEEATKRAESQLENTRLKIEGVLDQVEATIRNNVRLTQWGFGHLDSLHMITSIIVRENPVVSGSTIALVPGYSRRYPLFAPYSYNDPETGEILSKSLATKEPMPPLPACMTTTLTAAKALMLRAFTENVLSDSPIQAPASNHIFASAISSRGHSHGTMPPSGGCNLSFGDRIGSRPTSGHGIPSAGSSNFIPRSASGW